MDRTQQASTSTSSPVVSTFPTNALGGGTARPIVPCQPKKSILKRPPPPPRTFFNLSLPTGLSRFIPATSTNSNASNASSSITSPRTTTASVFQNQQHQSSAALLPSAVPYDDQPTESNGTLNANGGTNKSNANPTLKRAHFILPHLSTVYPISSAAPPSSTELTEAKQEIDNNVLKARTKEKEEGPGAWSLGRIEDFYRECCKLRDEQPLGGVVGALRQANLIAPRTLDLTAVKLTVDASAALADALSIEWGLRKLILRDCDLDDASLKHLLHALLIPGTLASLSLSCNRRMKQSAFKIVGAYIEQSDTIEFIDLSQIPLDKRSVEYIIQHIPPTPATQGPGQPNALFFSTPGSPLASPIYSSITSPSTYFPPLVSDVRWKSLTSAGSEMDKDHNDTNSLFGGASVTGLSMPEKLQVPLLSLRLDECSLRGAALDVLAHAIRPSAVQHVSLRGNKVGPPGAVALALMIRDYPDSVPLGTMSSPSATTTSFSNHTSPSPFNIIQSSNTPVRNGSITSNSSTPSSLPSPPATPPPSAPRALSLTIPETPSASLPPPPRHPGVAKPTLLNSPLGSKGSAPPPVATTYTPYIPRSKRNLIAASSSNGSMSSTMTSPPTNPSPSPGVPIFQSSRTGGVTARVTATAPTPRPGSAGGPPNRLGLEARLANASGRVVSSPMPSAHQKAQLDGHSAALLDNIRSLDNLPRLGSLTTLDLRGNDLRSGVQYIAQVLKRNRTLRVLSLADNRIDVQGLVYIAEALKYNSTLETLDMSHNPCCGPPLEGVTALRTAFTINTALKRLYLSATGMTSLGAIALAEFLPDAGCLLHLDLTHNKVDLAGVHALSAGLKVNQVMRCLDVSIPPNDPEMARLSREILRCCVRNTEKVATPNLNQGSSSSISMSEDLDRLFGSGTRGGVWGLIERSELARGIKQTVERQRVGAERQALNAPENKHKLEIWRKTPEEVMKTARDLLKEAQGAPEAVDSEALLERGQALVVAVAEIVATEKDPSRLEELLELSDRLNGLIKDLKSGRAPYGSERPGAVRRNSKGKEKAPEYVDFNLSSSVAMSPSFSISSDDEPATPPPRAASPEGIVGSGADSAAGTSSSSSAAVADEYEEPQATTLSKSWVEEEGEVFRKGAVLLGPEELGEEGADINSKELKQKLLEAQVERKPRHDELEDPAPST